MHKFDELWSQIFAKTLLSLQNLHYVQRLTCTCWYFMWTTNHVLQMTSTYSPCHRWINSRGYFFGKHTRNRMYASLPLALSVCWCLGWLIVDGHVTSPTFSDASMCRWTSEGLNKHMHCILSIIVLNVTCRVERDVIRNRVSRGTQETWGPEGQIVCLGFFD